MKRWSGTVVLMAAAACLALLAGCEGDQGPAGPPGATNCTEACHTDSYDVQNYIRVKQAEYEASQHRNAETFVRRGSSCSRCHTSEGFMHFVATGEQIEVEASSPIGCFTCHAPHSNENFALRVSGAVELMAGGTYDKQESNLCATCHQARPASPAIADVATAITSSRWGTHHGPQSNLLSGNSAWDFGSPYPTDAAHNSIAKGCVNCHMAETASNGLAGGHTFGMEFEYHGSVEVNSKGCTCHGWDDEAATEEVEEHKEHFGAELEELGNALVALGWMRSLTSVNGSGIPANADARGAVFNYQMLREDLSMGIHNPKYAEAILEATAAFVDAQ